MKVEAELIKCDICNAPYRKPLTPGWTKTSYKVGTRWMVQIHRPECPAGWSPANDTSEDDA